MADPRFLRVAREALGLTQKQLAAQTGLEQADVSRWERGLRTPSESQLERLAGGLAVPAALLADDVRLTQPVHRTARIESKRTERMVDARLELARLGASRLLADIDIETPFQFPGPDDPAPADPEEAAEAVRRVWRIPEGPVGDLVGHLESAGAVVLRVDFGHDSVLAAYAHLRGDYRWCFLNVRAEDGARARFSLAHELGHALLHWDRFDAPTDRDAEREAHRFAAALLMPRREMLATFARARLSLDDLVAVRQRWRVSIQALVMRAHDLGLISQHQRARLFQQIGARGWRRREPGVIELERPSTLPGALEIHRDQHGYSERDLAQLAGLPLERLADLMPDHFRRPGVRRGLRLV